MAQNDRLPPIREQILLTMWKLKAIGKTTIKEETLRAEMGPEIAESLASEIEQLQKRGFLEKNSSNGVTISLTPLGLSILRQVEEDHLQELK
jgi:predicted transcriptional regulator